jgi:hypothetical protein
MDNKTHTIEVDGNKYTIINGTQSDGRCFAASVYYDLYNKIPDDTELNNWIQTNIIVPIINTENTDCLKFFTWAINWAGTHNSMLEDNPYTYTIIDNVIELSPEITILKIVFDRIVSLQEYVDKIKIDKNMSKEDMIKFIEYLLEKIDNDFLYGIDKILGDDGINQKQISEAKQVIRDIQNNKLLQELIEHINNASKVTDQEELYFVCLDLQRRLLQDIKDILIIICEQAKNIDGYQNLINNYKRYINALNIPKNIEGIDKYEWTEPDGGPISVLLDNNLIRSINIYDVNNTNHKQTSHLK